MKTMGLFSLVVICFTTISLGQESKSAKPWMDLEHCDFCKNMSSQKGLMEHMKCDMYNIANGSITVTYVPDNLREALHKANAAMEATAKRMQAGETLHTCGFCDAIGMAMSRGAKMERLSGEAGEVTMFTSDDAEVVRLIHEMTDRTNKEKKNLAVKPPQDPVPQKNLGPKK